MEAKPRHNTVDVPALFWAAIPGNAGDFPAEETEKLELQRLTEKLDGNIELAIRQLAESKRNK